MIKDLDETIKELLKVKLPSVITGQYNMDTFVSFARPDESFTAPALNVFLYDVVENLEYRSSRMGILEKSGGKDFVEAYPPVRVNCSYLITAWSDVDPKDEHYLLSEVMKVLLRHRELPKDILQGELHGLKPLPVTISLHQCKLNPGEFWQALGGKPRAALNYTVTVDVSVHEPREVTLVESDKYAVETEHHTK